MADLSHLQLYLTQPHDCSYLEGEEATTAFIDPSIQIDQHTYTQLSQLGFRRSGPHVYRPQCAKCHACISSRIPVSRFKPNRSQKRIWKRNSDLRIEALSNIQGDQFFELYSKYIHARHSDGDMFPPTRDQYDNFLTNQWGDTAYLAFYDAEKLVAAAVTDVLNSGLSAIYTFYDTGEDKRGLGIYAVLYQIELARQQGLEHVYLGYWIKQCQKMSYKIKYRPIELLIDQQWVLVN
ncbi:MAG: arginyltransferase [Cellvibrionaceae bacterium]